MKRMIGIIVVLSLANSPIIAKPRPAPPNAPNTVQWKDVVESMAELVERGYVLVSTAASGDQDEITTYFLSKGPELMKCRDGVVLINNRGFVANCAKLVRPYRVD